jgi:hypothetical protein
VVDGDVLNSAAIEDNSRRTYFLSDAAKNKFNGRIRAIWGDEASVSVSQWNEDRARDFYRNCEGLATTTEQGLEPNPVPFEVLNEIDTMIEQEQAAEAAIQAVRARYERLLEEAGDLGDRVALSTAHYNAVIWARDSDQAITGYENAHRLLDEQLAASVYEDWTPDAEGIIASARLITKLRSRFHSVVQVKKDLAILLQ